MGGQVEQHDRALVRGPGPFVEPAGQREPLLAFKGGEAVAGADLLLVIPAGLLLAVPLQVGGLQAELLGDVVDHRGGNVLGIVQEAVQEPCGAQLQGPAELVAGAVGGHRPAPVVGIQVEEGAQLSDVGDAVGNAVSAALLGGQETDRHGGPPGTPGRPHLARRGRGAVGYQQRSGQIIDVTDYVMNCVSLAPAMIAAVRLMTVALHACPKCVPVLWLRAEPSPGGLHVPVLRGVGGNRGPFSATCPTL